MARGSMFPQKRSKWTFQYPKTLENPVSSNFVPSFERTSQTIVALVRFEREDGVYDVVYRWGEEGCGKRGTIVASWSPG